MKSDIEGVSISWGSLKGKWPPPEESDTVLCKTDTALHMMRVSLHCGLTIYKKYLNNICEQKDRCTDNKKYWNCIRST